MASIYEQHRLSWKFMAKVLLLLLPEKIFNKPEPQRMREEECSKDHLRILNFYLNWIHQWNSFIIDVHICSLEWRRTVYDLFLFCFFRFCKPSFPYLYIIHFYSVFVPHRTNNNISMFLQIHEFQTYLTNIENIGEDDDEEEREKYHWYMENVKLHPEIYIAIFTYILWMKT